jgi:general stress protein 26
VALPSLPYGAACVPVGQGLAAKGLDLVAACEGRAYEGRQVSMTAADLLTFMREHRFAVQASVSPTGAAQAAVVGFVVTDDFEVFFDTSDTSRKVNNFRRNPQVALVIGGTTVGDERSVQYEGTVDEPTGLELRRLKELYFESFPDGREREAWPSITYIRARPRWIRYTDFNREPPETIEFHVAELGVDESG